MKAAIQDRYGTPNIVRVEEVDKPIAGESELLVRVHAASVNRADLDGLGPRPGFVRLFIGLRAPRNHRTGTDVAGVVESVGANVMRFKPGDRVFADLFSVGQGAFAEYVTAPEKAFASIPPAMSFEDAATLPHSAVLAIQGLRLRSGRTIKPGDEVLIEGASGNVGPFAVQIAKSMGAIVTGVCSTTKMDFVRSLGADHVIDYKSVDFTNAGKRYDWILSAEAHHWLLRYRRALRAKGVYVTLGAPTTASFVSLLLGSLLAKATSNSMGLMLWWKPFHAPDVVRLAELIASDKVKPAIDRRYPLSEVVDALRYVDDGRARGKVIITPLTALPSAFAHLTPVGILPPVRSIPARTIEAIVPARLGRSFRWLLASTVINNAGDGVVLAAGPLLVASETRDPLLVSMALLSEYLPVLLFGVLGGAVADRFDRRQIVVLGAVLVRVRRLGGARRDPVAAVRPHRTFEHGLNDRAGLQPSFRFGLSEPRQFVLKRVDEPVEVRSVSWR